MSDFEKGLDRYHHRTDLFSHPFQKVKTPPPPLTPEEQELRAAVRQCIGNRQKAEEESRQAILLGGHSSLYARGVIANRCSRSR